LRSLPTVSGTALDVAGNGRDARKIVTARPRPSRMDLAMLVDHAGRAQALALA
jgi:hypothetical protein